MNAAGSSDAAAKGDPAAKSDAAAAEGTRAVEPKTPGELLKRERERRSISVQQAAEDLHLDTKVVQAIEANRFDLLGVPVYARGHLRKYAALVGLSPEFIIQRYEALTDRPAVPSPVPASASVFTSVTLERRSRRFPFWLAIGLIVLALGWWLFTALWPSAARSDLPASAPPVEAPPVEEAPTSEVPAAAVNTPPAMTPVSLPAPAAAQPGDVRVRLEYNDASWTEIYDASGKRLLYGHGESGRTRSVSGTPPLRITLGKASAVTMQVNDRSVVVPRLPKRDSARFSIAANGAVQMTSGEVSVE